MLNQYTGEHPQVHREPFYCRRLALMTGCVIRVCFLPVAGTQGVCFFLLIVDSDGPPETSALQWHPNPNNWDTK